MILDFRMIGRHMRYMMNPANLGKETDYGTD
jgi:hypothetical protein